VASCQGLVDAVACGAMNDTEHIQELQHQLAHDHAVVRSGLSAFLLAYDDLELMGEAGNRHEHGCIEHIVG